MSDFFQMQKDFQSLESGMPRLHGIRNAIREADARKELYWQFHFRFLYLKESVFCGDRYFAMIIFPELLALYDQNLSLQEDEACAYNILIAFKWIVEAAPEFPQISKAQIDGYFRLFQKRLLQQGYSLSIYYMKHQLFYMHCNQAIAAADFYRFLEAPLDSISDGKALFYDQQAMYYLSVGDEEKALQAAKPIFDGRMKSNALPQSTYHDFMVFYMKNGRYQEAEHYAVLAEPKVNCDPYYLDIIGSMLILYSILHPEKGASLFSQNVSVYLQSKNPMLRMRFEMGAYKLFSVLSEISSDLEVCVPYSSSLYLLAHEKNYAGIAAYFEAEASSAARKFDERNGTEDFMQLLYFPYPD